MNSAVIRYLDGRLLKGFVDEVSGTEDVITVRPAEGPSQEEIQVPMKGLKAIFFVRRLEGNTVYHERKKYGLRDRLDRKIIIRFKDGEFLVGFIQGEVPWRKGFFLSPERKSKGFYLLPADESSNNLKVFVVASAISDVTTP